MRETDIVRRLSQLKQHRNRAVIEGIGDDCAIVRPQAGSDLVFTTDFVLEDRHFALRTHAPEAIGHKALARSLSDLAAMGSDPVFCLVSLALPANLTGQWIDGFYKGLLKLAQKHKITLAGGDLSKYDKVIVDVMCCGKIPKGAALLRSGAKPGDRIYVTGELGAAAASNWMRAPEPRVAAGRKLR
jgi:thiamine-monophosphate kinase